MQAPVYIGDEVSAAGYRLAGFRVRVPEPGGESAALAEARAQAPLVLVAANVAARIDAETMRIALSASGASHPGARPPRGEWREATPDAEHAGALAPLVLIVPDLLGTTPVPDVGAKLRRQLGL